LIAQLSFYLNRARYHGSCNNLFDLRCTAVVHNLHVIAKIVAQAEKQIAARAAD
jgi:hypothetical protein